LRLQLEISPDSVYITLINADISGGALALRPRARMRFSRIIPVDRRRFMSGASGY
jgi:hypothetical protein